MDYLFDKNWFKKWQGVLLWLLNEPIVRIWFRWVLRLNGKASSVGKEKIIRIEPNSISWGIKKVSKNTIQLTTEFRPHNKYSKRLFYAFYPLWYLFHLWDTLIANNLKPAWDLGFNSLTVYPDANVESTSVDGEVYQHYGSDSTTDWATLIAAAGNLNADFGADHDSGNPDFGFYFQGATATDKWWGLLRNPILFDTSSLGASASISAAVLSVRGDTKNDSLGVTPTADIYTCNPASNTALADGDYNRTLWGSTSQTGSPITYANYSTTGYNDFTFNATGIGNISKTGISKFGIRNANYDVAAVVPTWSASNNSNISHYSADAAGTDTDPKLVVTYIISISNFFLMF